MCDLVLVEVNESLENVAGDVGNLDLGELVDRHGLHEGGAFEVLHDHPDFILHQVCAMKGYNVRMLAAVPQKSDFLESLTFVLA